MAVGAPPLPPGVRRLVRAGRPDIQDGRPGSLLRDVLEAVLPERAAARADPRAAAPRAGAKC